VPKFLLTRETLGFPFTHLSTDYSAGTVDKFSDQTFVSWPFCSLMYGRGLQYLFLENDYSSNYR
jgi:hypothetical protein